jgi:hypothetical protein
MIDIKIPIYPSDKPQKNPLQLIILNKDIRPAIIGNPNPIPFFIIRFDLAIDIGKTVIMLIQNKVVNAPNKSIGKLLPPPETNDTVKKIRNNIISNSNIPNFTLLIRENIPGFLFCFIILI